jgi:hypothetical protein
MRSNATVLELLIQYYLFQAVSKAISFIIILYMNISIYFFMSSTIDLPGNLHIESIFFIINEMTFLFLLYIALEVIFKFILCINFISKGHYGALIKKGYIAIVGLTVLGSALRCLQNFFTLSVVLVSFLFPLKNV